MGSFKFIFALETVSFTENTFCTKSDKSIYGLLCLLSYWKSINSNLRTYQG